MDKEQVADKRDTKVVEGSYNVGVIVGRFQTDDLTEGHRDLIDYVFSQHKKVLIFLGVSPVPFTYHNPLDYVTRKLMIERAYPKAVVLPIKDVGNNDLWSTILDESIRNVFPTGKPMLYGSRSSFVDAYEGSFDTTVLEPEKIVSATARRKDIEEDIRTSKDFRRGIIYACSNRFFNALSVIDVAAVSEDGTELLLGRKKDQKKYRFIGGFVDVLLDENMSDTVRREFREETGAGQIEFITYVTDVLTDDWRYRKERDKILTTLFKGVYTGGDLEPSDDIVELRWFKIKDLKGNGNVFHSKSFAFENMVYPHLKLLDAFLESISET